MGYGFNLQALGIPLDKSGSGESPFITEGPDGVRTIRWMSTPSGDLFDMYLDDAGTVVTTPVGVTEYLLLETGDFLLLETGDKLILE